MGGEFFTTVVGMMNTYGRVALCGAISEYHLPDNQPLGKYLLIHVYDKVSEI